MIENLFRKIFDTLKDQIDTANLIHEMGLIYSEVCFQICLLTWNIKVVLLNLLIFWIVWFLNVILISFQEQMFRSAFTWNHLNRNRLGFDQRFLRYLHLQLTLICFVFRLEPQNRRQWKTQQFLGKVDHDLVHLGSKQNEMYFEIHKYI